MKSMKMTCAALIALALITSAPTSADSDCQETNGIIGIGLLGIIGIGQSGIIGIGTLGIIGIGEEDEAPTSSQLSCEEPDVSAFGIIGIGAEEG